MPQAPNMKRTYLLRTEPSGDLSAAVFAVGVASPLESLGQLEKELKRKHVRGKVLFDLLLAHGSKANRYFIGDFDGEHFRSAKFSNVDSRYKDFSAISAQVLQKNVEQVDSSLLSQAMRFALEKGIPF